MRTNELWAGFGRLAVEARDVQAAFIRAALWTMTTVAAAPPVNAVAIALEGADHDEGMRVTDLVPRSRRSSGAMTGEAVGLISDCARHLVWDRAPVWTPFCLPRARAADIDRRYTQPGTFVLDFARVLAEIDDPFVRDDGHVVDRSRPS